MWCPMPMTYKNAFSSEFVIKSSAVYIAHLSMRTMVIVIGYM